MAWQELTPLAPSWNALAAAPVKFGISKMGGAGDARAPRFLSLDLLESLVERAPEQWRFRMFVGGGESAGWLRVEPHQEGLFVGRPTSRGRTIIVPFDRPAGYPNQGRKTEAVPHRKAGIAIEVRLPGLRAAAVPPPPAKSTPSNVTAQLMGDPKPGRSAADQQKGA